MGDMPDNVFVRLMTGSDIGIQGHQDIDWKGRIPRIVFALLALNAGTPVSRDRLAGLIWTDSDQQAARRNLRTALLTLRKSLQHVDPELISAEIEAVTLRLDPEDVDIHLFESLAAQKTQASADQALALYGGDLLADLPMPAGEISEQFRIIRHKLRSIALETGLWLLNEREKGNDPNAVESVARRLLDIDPATETAHRAIIRSHLLQGDRAGALSQFDLCTAVLKDQLDLEPSEETLQLHREILSHDPGGSDRSHPKISRTATSIPINIRPAMFSAARFFRYLPYWPASAVLGLLLLFGLGAAGYRALTPPAPDKTGGMIVMAPIYADLSTCSSKTLSAILYRLQQGALVSLPGFDVMLTDDEEYPTPEEYRTFLSRTSLQCVAEDIRITVEMRDLDTGVVIWAGQYDGKIGTIESLIERIMEDIRPLLLES